MASHGHEDQWSFGEPIDLAGERHHSEGELSAVPVRITPGFPKVGSSSSLTCSFTFDQMGEFGTPHFMPGRSSKAECDHKIDIAVTAVSETEATRERIGFAEEGRTELPDRRT